MSAAAENPAWPALPLASWQETYATLHMWTQIVGKTRLALAPMENHWWQIPLYVTARGLGTGPMPTGGENLSAEFDFIDHALNLRTSGGARETMTLAPRSVADFYAAYRAALRALGVAVAIHPMPVEIETAIPFPEDRTHKSYDSDAAHQFWRILLGADRVLKRFRGRFLGKQSPSHFFWGSFDMAATRFSGRKAPAHGGGVPNCPDYVMVEAYSHECASCGFWPGGAPMPEPIFYAYAYPEPAGYAAQRVAPAPARYDSAMHEFVLPYDAVRKAADPDTMLLSFFQSAYEAAAELGNWDRAALERPVTEWP